MINGLHLIEKKLLFYSKQRELEKNILKGGYFMKGSRILVTTLVICMLLVFVGSIFAEAEAT